MHSGRVSVALDFEGDTLAVGALDEDSNAFGVFHNAADPARLDNTAPQAGAVFVFARAGALWSQQAHIKVSNTEPNDNAGFANDRFGAAVSLSFDGHTLAVGAPEEDSVAANVGGDAFNNDAFESGAAYVFARDANMQWSQSAYVKAFNTQSADWFGSSLTLSGDGAVLAVGSPGEDSAARGVMGADGEGAPAAGAVYVYARSNAGWISRRYIKASNTESQGDFGWAVALSFDGRTLAIGAPDEDGGSRGVNGDQTSNDEVDAGAVYLY